MSNKIRERRFIPLQNTEFFTHLYGAARKGIMGNLANMTNGSLGFVEPTPIVDGGRVHLSVFLVTKPSVEGEGERDTIVVCVRACTCVRVHACVHTFVHVCVFVRCVSVCQSWLFTFEFDIKKHILG